MSLATLHNASSSRDVPRQGGLLLKVALGIPCANPVVEHQREYGWQLGL